MKKYFAALSATTLIGITPYALAASTADLTVTGIIRPSACTPSFPGGSNVNFGEIRKSNLNQTTLTTLTPQTKQLNVTCEAPTRFAMHVIDNRPGTTSFTHFGMGLTPANERLGHFVPWLHNVVADGESARSILSVNQGDTWQPAPHIAPNQYLSVSSLSDTTPIAAESVSMDVQIRAWIARADGLTLNEEVALDGSMTFEMKYL
ncbi:Protein GltF [Pseudomonas fluorescens]|uniref:Protein GltF n=1 Tax=Pseudomonas fluorescens TaxID=294 RepID=A0A5E7TS03_PSEFL|nr:DUF1120 domain-containing protein [Pseudomonas fluorescens]VVQ01843.1 Protein GltF [Pseudomonas fluorescens]